MAFLTYKKNYIVNSRDKKQDMAFLTYKKKPPVKSLSKLKNFSINEYSKKGISIITYRKKK